MSPLEKHRLILYGRIVTSVGLFLVFFALSVTAAVTDVLLSETIWITALLVLAVVVLPRRSEPGSDAARQQVDEQELEKYQQIRKWLTWVRFGYLGVAILTLLLLPEIV